MKPSLATNKPSLASDQYLQVSTFKRCRPFDYSALVTEKLLLHGAFVLVLDGSVKGDGVDVIVAVDSRKECITACRKTRER